VEATLATNHLGQLLLLHELLPLLLAAPSGARVVLVSSDLHKRAMTSNASASAPAVFPDQLFALSPALNSGNGADSSSVAYNGMQVMCVLCIICANTCGMLGMFHSGLLCAC
jgi:NAD(P)-dependent dehydrogenase (short-subunit alcohol dehydrogenase family)